MKQYQYYKNSASKLLRMDLESEIIEALDHTGEWHQLYLNRRDLNVYGKVNLSNVTSISYWYSKTIIKYRLSLTRLGRLFA